MKLAWLVWEYADSDSPDICFCEPSGWNYKVVPIVYAELKE